VDFFVEVVHADHRKRLRTQGMKVVMDRYFDRSLLMGSMSFSSSSGSSSTSESKHFMEPARTP
jgi:hypothetical protein